MARPRRGHQHLRRRRRRRPSLLIAMTAILPLSASFSAALARYRSRGGAAASFVAAAVGQPRPRPTRAAAVGGGPRGGGATTASSSPPGRRSARSLAPSADECPSASAETTSGGGGGGGGADRPSLARLARRAMDEVFDEKPGAAATSDDGVRVRSDDGEEGENLRSARIAARFLAGASPAFLESELAEDPDRLVKIGRSLPDLLPSLAAGEGGEEEEERLAEAPLRLLVEECDVLASGDVAVPKVRFGRTELRMPIVSLGCMRFQQAWGPNITSMDDVTPECQSNLVGILRRAARLGITHVETARGYGCSELQLGEAFRQLFASGEVRREDLIVQTKCPAKATAAEFRDVLERSFRDLGLEYVDLFSFHGVNMEEQYDLIFDNGDNSLIDVVREYVAAGRIRHVGFSTHARPELIRRLIETDVFDYVNLHYHYFGSYTASGDGPHGGNLGIVRLLKERDMGVFIISVNDKGGRLYAPSRKLRSLTLPDMEPMAFGLSWLWNHAWLDDVAAAPVHTVSVGAARPSDLDQPAVAAHLHGSRHGETAARLDRVLQRMRRAEEEALGREWAESWHEGLPNWYDSTDAVPHGYVVWLHNLIRSYGMLEYARDRYGPLANNLRDWDSDLGKGENIDNIGRIKWGWTPGCAARRDGDYAADLAGVPGWRRERVREAEEFVRRWCGGTDEELGDGVDAEEMEPPREWETAYDMRPWTAFPERKKSS